MTRLTVLAFVAIAAAGTSLEAQFTPSQDFSERVLFAFRQGAQNNCAITGVIKAAIATYGMEPTNGVFASDVTKDDGSHDIVMRDGTKLSVSEDQIQQAKDIASWAAAPSHPIDDGILGRATVLYAAMARRAVDLKNIDTFSDAKDFSSSLQRLSDPGRNSDVQPQLLGLACKQIALSDVSKPVYVHANYYHAAFSILEKYDQTGEEIPLVPYFQKYHHKILHNGPSNWENFVLVDPQGPLQVNQENPCPEPSVALAPAANAPAK